MFLCVCSHDEIGLLFIFYLKVVNVHKTFPSLIKIHNVIATTKEYCENFTDIPEIPKHEVLLQNILP